MSSSTRCCNDPQIWRVGCGGLQGLRPMVGDAEVRKALLQVLRDDDSPAVRRKAVDVLVAQRDKFRWWRAFKQNLYQKEDNNYIRLKLEKALKDMNARSGSF